MKHTPFTIALLLLAGCSIHKTNTSITQMQFDKEGHRGCRGLMPENTIPAFIKAIDLGVTTLEMDAVITSDRRVIISHEPFFNHEITTKPDGSYVDEKEEKQLNIYKMSYGEVKTYDVGKKPHPRFPQQQKMPATKPLLSDVIDAAEAYCRTNKLKPVFYNIETKSQPETDNVYHPEPVAFVELIMDVLRSKNIMDRVIIQSFDFRTLQYVHAKYPFLKTAMLIESFDKRDLEGQIKDLGFIPTIYSPDYSLVNEALIKKCHGMNMKVIPWTVDDLETIKKLREMGVDGIITDYPDLYGKM